MRHTRREIRAAPPARIGRMKTGRIAIVALIALGTVARVRAAEAPADGLQTGMTLDQSNWQLADSLLPPEILEHYKTGGYKNLIVEFPLGLYSWAPDFKASTEKNAGQFKVSP